MSSGRVVTLRVEMTAYTQDDLPRTEDEPLRWRDVALGLTLCAWDALRRWVRG